ncbi:PXA domain-containing protein [Trichophaea hybrida]|nr:PXA domain-containing protein [Trichophaea hybrida]
MYHRISSKRGADTFLLFLMSASNTFIVFLRELAAARASIENYLEDSPSSAMAQLLDRDLQRRKLRMAADDVLQSFFGKNILQCEPVRVFLTEILSGVVLEMTVDKCSQPDWINSWLVYLLEEETQPEVLQKIDMGEATAVDGDRQAENLKRISRAEEEMALAIEEAEAMNRMIVEEEDRKRMSMDVNGVDGSNSIRKSTSSIMEPGSIAEEEALEPAPAQPSPPEPFFISFDQLSGTTRDNTLHRAHISVSDLTPATTNNPYSVTPNEKALRSKPTAAEYLLQIEPASPQMPGWVVVRKYTDFETLHEVLRRIAAISGAETFRRHHAEVPTWRGETLGSLRFNLEGYLNDALHERGLADCEGMKRFLEKDPGTTPGKTGFGIGKAWPNPAAFAKMGQGALDALAKAPQGVTEGGKGLFGGMKKAFTIGGQRGEDGGTVQPGNHRRQSTDPFGDLSIDFQSHSRPASIREDPRNTNGNRSSRASSIHRFDSKKPETSASSVRDNGCIQLELPPREEGDNVSVVSLPPPPSDMPDDYESPITTTANNRTFPPPELAPPKLPPRQKKEKEPLTTQETQFIIDIVFALLTELYTLSSAWTLRRSLLNVAKSILLRPGNASLENIRIVIQETVIDANTSDTAVAALIRKVRENIFPTQEEMDAWTDDELKGEELRKKARRLVLEKGVPEALRGVMGAVASEEALANVFDAVQMPIVARGVVGGVVLEGVRGVCQ